MKKASWFFLTAMTLAMPVMRPLALVALPTVAVVASTGCSTPAKAYSTYNETYIATVRSITDLRTAGKIKEDKYQRDILPQINRGNEIARAWRKQLDENPGATTPDYRALARTVLDALLRYELEHRSNP